MIGLVLAAGAGRRLRPVTDDIPKALAPIAEDRTILDVALANLARAGLTDVAVVVGYAADVVRERAPRLEERHGVRLELVLNDRAEEWNNAYSLWCARDLLRQGALLVNGDTVHPVDMEQRLLAAPQPALTLAIDDDKELGEEEMKVRFDDRGTLTHITKLMEPKTAHGEYVGLSRIDGDVAADVADALEATWRRDPSLYYEDGYGEYAARGGLVQRVSVGGLSWVEVDNHADLARAREIACLC